MAYGVGAVAVSHAHGVQVSHAMGQADGQLSVQEACHLPPHQSRQQTHAAAHVESATNWAGVWI